MVYSQQLKALQKRRTQLVRQAHVVLSVDRAARELRVDANQLAAVIHAARLQPWGEDAWSRPVFRWTTLLELASTITPERAFEEA
jgi:hypothetical protein